MENTPLTLIERITRYGLRTLSTVGRCRGVRPVLLAALVVTVVLFVLVALVAIAYFGPRCSRGPKSHEAAPHRESQGPPTERSSAPERGGLSKTNGVPMFTTVFARIALHALNILSSADKEGAGSRFIRWSMLLVVLFAMLAIVFVQTSTSHECQQADATWKGKAWAWLLVCAAWLTRESGSALILIALEIFFRGC